MTSFPARYWREGGVWEVELYDEPGVHTFASTLGRARRYIREATALWFDVPVDQVAIDDVVELPGGLAGRVDLLLRHRAELDRVVVEVGFETTAVVAELIRAGLSVRDAGEVVHLSPQRVSQLTRTATGG